MRARLGRIYARAVATPGWVRIVAALVVIAIIAGGVATAVNSGSGTTIRTSAAMLPVTDGPDHNQHVRIDTTLYVPSGVDSRHRAPAVIVAHGFGQTKDSVASDARALAKHGYVVLAFTARGFGHSTGQVALDSPEYEITDVRALVDWLARQPEVTLDAPGDPKVGIVGGSYGGAAALLTAGYDTRVDAIVPTITWNNLATAFFRNAAAPRITHGPAPAGQAGTDAVFARSWAGLFFGGSGGCGRFVAAVCAIDQQAAAGRPIPASAIALLEHSSPSQVLDRVRAPTLLIQGETDSLFGLDQAEANAAGLRAAGTPVRVAWYAGGHDGGAALNETDRVRSLTLSWLDHWLRGKRDPGRSFTFSRISPGVAGTPTISQRRATAYPTGGLGAQTLRLRGGAQQVSNPAGGSPAAISSIPGIAGSISGGGSPASSGAGLGSGGAAGSALSSLAGRLATDVPGQFASFTSARLSKPLSLTGSARIRITVSGTSSPVTLFGKIYDRSGTGSRTLPQGLVAPARVGPGEATVTLPALVHTFPAGHRLQVVFSTTDQAYATPTAPATFRVSLAAAGVTLPVFGSSAVASSSPDWPWWLAAALIAVAGAAAVALSGRLRRPHRAGSDVPLVVSGLSKRYPSGLLAVDDVSFTVTAGQVLGLLGPNGAGKTTLLRMLTGLIRPSAGSLRVYGETVTPGAEVLRRVGAFIEGPGPLPHLSGRDNLALYWGATGRPDEQARLDEALAIAGLGDALSRPVRGYSNGMRQRLAIAQAMLGLPDLLVLDEPTNGLDPPQIRAFRDVLRDYAASGRTVIVSSHLLAEVERSCSHIVVMDDGRLLAAGTVAELTAAGAVISVVVDDPDAAREVLLARPGVTSVIPGHEDSELLVTTRQISAAGLNSALVGAGIAVHRLSARRALEDTFVNLIGAR